MKNVLFGAALLVAGFGASLVSAAEPSKAVSVKATTNELPAALAALNPSKEKILSLNQAKEIRGEGGWGGWGHWGGNINITTNITTNINITNITVNVRGSNNIVVVR